MVKVTIEQGELIGKEEISIPNSKIYHSFYGIPYAEPPVKTLRFQAPVPHKGWQGVLDATEPRSACLQKTAYISSEAFGSEDCLFVNVHVPQTSDKKLKPVMVFVHGGAFLGGMGHYYQPNYLMEYDVVVVTFNYRLHIFGFLNLGLPECPGNVGFKDQVLLFKWVRDNIEAFGGDPTNVTAVGQSAGAASVNYLIISPLSKGLFNRAILQSGTALAPFALVDEPSKYAFQIGEVLGINTTDKRKLLEFLLKVPADELAKVARRIVGKYSRKTCYFGLIFTASVEQETDPCKAFLPEHPKVLMKKASYVPILTGVNDLESLILFTDDALAVVQNVLQNELLLPKELKFVNTSKEKVIKEVQKFYFNGKIPNDKTIPEILDVISDALYQHPMHEMCFYILENHPGIPVYKYNFSYEGALNMTKRLVQEVHKDFNTKGSAHMDEVYYLFFIETPLGCPPYKKELPMIKTLCTLWTNFVKYGTPAVATSEFEWSPTTIKNPCYLHLDDPIQLKRGIINNERMKFWDTIIYEKHLRNLHVKM